MKKILISLVALAFAITVYSQECYTTWPYIYPDFTEGTIYMSDGQKILQNMNVHVAKGRLHYIDNGIVKEASAKDIVMIAIGEDRYMFVNGDVMKVIGSEERGFVATHSVADFQRLQESGGAYGTSSASSATMKLSSVDMPGANTNHMELRQNKLSGKEISLKTTYYLVTGGKVYQASKKGIEEKLTPEQKAQFKTFLKEHKIKWRDPDSLLTLLDFLNK